jgi:hypothetical protein
MPPPPEKEATRSSQASLRPFPAPLDPCVLGSLFLISVICFITSIGIYIANQSRQSAFLVIIILVLTLFLWLLSLFKRRTERCPLCHGTPYLNTAANKHVKATKLPFLNYGISNLMRTIFTRKFRWMFCGQLDDFLKKRINPTNRSKK